MLKNKFQLILLVLSSFLMSSPIFAGTAVYAQLVSNADQVATADTVNQGIPIALQVTDSINGLQWDSQNNKMIIKEAGVYVILSDVQVGARESATNIVKGGDLYYWLDLNGSPIADTGNWVFASPQSRSKTISNVWVMPLKKDDALRFMYASSAPSMGLITIPPTNNIPNSPGLTLTMFKLDTSTPAPPTLKPASQPSPAAPATP